MSLPMYPPDAVRAHYEYLLGDNYLWMAGGREANTGRCRAFFVSHGILPRGSGTALDLGAGCGFQSVPLAELGFRVTAVDFSTGMLGILARQSDGLPITVIPADILEYPAWAGKSPELIVCMGDTLAHLPDIPAVREFLRHCCAELVPGGRLVLSLRNYSHGAAGSVEVIPVRRDADRIFLCRLAYDPDVVHVTDILYTRQSGTWERHSGSYPKLRIAPDLLKGILGNAGFTVAADERTDRHLSLIAEKVSGSLSCRNSPRIHDAEAFQKKA